MNDVEKTIKALECMTGAMVGITCDGCPLYGDVEMRKGKNVWTCKMCTAKDAEVLKSALVLLKTLWHDTCKKKDCSDCKRQFTECDPTGNYYLAQKCWEDCHNTAGFRGLWEWKGVKEDD